MKTILNKNNLLALGISVLTVGAFADDMNMKTPTGATTATSPKPAERPHPIAAAMMLTAQGFVTDASMGNLKEVAFGREALNKSQNADVRRLAEMIVQDHTMANNQLRQIAEEEGLNCPATNTFAANDPMWNSPLLTNPESVHGAEMLVTNATYVPEYQAFAHLKSLNGPAFDQAYVSDMVSDHAEDIPKFEKAARELTDAKLKQFAEDQLPVLRKHYRMAQDIAGKVAATKTPGANDLQSAAIR